MTPDALAPLIAQGFSLFPLGNGGGPRAKKPRVKWEPYQQAAPSDNQVEAWAAKWPNANWAIVCGLVSGVVVLDCDTQAAISWAAEHLHATPYWVQSSRGRHLYYKHPGADALPMLQSLRSRLAALNIGLDLQCDGHYVVAPGSLHDDGKTVYTLHENFPGCWDIVPEFTLADGKGNLASFCTQNVPDRFGEKPEGQRNTALTSYIGARVAAGMDINSVIADALEQNRTINTPPISEKEVRDIVKSVFRMEAKKKKTTQAPMPPMPGTTPASPTATLAAEGFQLATIPDAKAADWPDEILHPGGLLEQITDYTMASSVRTERVFALAGAICLLGGVLGMRIQTNTGLTTNMYCMAIGNSSAGKDAPRKTISNILYAPGAIKSLQQVDAGSDTASDTAILSYLCRQGCQRAIFSLDEVGLFLKSTKVLNSARAGVMKLLTELYSSSCSKPYTKRYASADNDKTLPWRALSVFGTSVPSEFWNSLCDGEAINGFLARCLIFESTSEGPCPRYRDIQTDVPQNIIDGINALWSINVGDEGPEILESGGVNPYPIPTPYTIRMTEEALVYHEEHAKEQHLCQIKAERADHMAAATLHGRTAENALKLALIRWGSDFNGDMTAPISLTQTKWAWGTAKECLRRTLDQAELNIHNSEFEAWGQKIILTIRKFVQARKLKGQDVPGAPMRELHRALRSVPPKVMQDVVDKLVRQEVVRVLDKVPTTRRPLMNVVCLVEATDE